ncbi:hypothetical protein B0H13DRAFT_2349097 [Mycena leptocephala]|nr:hypothetical protein B0H13DRAFT_2349097 [Mycena leptocephala]
MDDFLLDSTGSTVEPTWSKRDDTWFCSFGASPDSIPRDALKFKAPLPYLLKSTTPDNVLTALDFAKSPVWYNPEEHWLSWVPLGKPNWSDHEEDPLAYLFDVRPVPTQANYTLMYGTGSDSDDPMEAKEVFAGYFLEESWQTTAKFHAELLHGICSTLATTTSWYCSDRWTGSSGDAPRKIEDTAITMVYSSEEGAQKAGAAIKRSTLSFTGFIAWFQTLIRLEDTSLHKEDQDYIRTLRLNDRPKAGVLYSMSRDLHEANFPHLILHRVPIHVAWTEEDKRNWRFLRLSPEVWGEYTAVRSSKAPSEMLSLADLPSGATWKEEWDRSDWFFQNRYAGKRGDILSEFLPTWDYAIIDFHLWGARPLLNPKRIRAYAERFKAALTTTDRGTICTFFRQNPIRLDEPPFDRAQPNPHVHQLTSFSLVTDNERVEENDLFYERTEVVREQNKNIYAPRPSRPFNSFNGAREIAPLDKSLRGNDSRFPTGRRQRSKRETPGSSLTSSYGEAWSNSPLKERLGPIISRSLSGPAPRSVTPEDAGLTSTWARKMAGRRRQASRSASPRGAPSRPLRRRSRSLATERTLDSDHEGGGSFAIEYAAASASEEGEVGPSALPEVESHHSGDHPFSGPSPVHTWEPGFQTEEQAREAIEAWAPDVVELIPVYGSYPGLAWNQDWLKDAILVCDDERTYWRLKAYAAVFKGFTKFEEILEVAIRMALPFAIYIKRSDVRRFSNPNVSSLDLKTLGALYTPGYVDLPLVWSGPGGGPAVYGQYEGRVGSLLGRPEAIAFVPMGGVCRFVAEVYDEKIVYRYAQGPSLQVSEFDEGEARRIDRFNGSTFYITDRVSHSEIYLLLGHIAGSDSGGDRTLWPTPEVFECESSHMRGYLSEGSYLILANLRRDIIERKRYKWRTYSQWKEYFRVGSKGDHEPKSIPKTKDFEAGAEIIKRAFPINWLDLDIGEIVLPEEFEPHAQRD